MTSIETRASLIPFAPAVDDGLARPPPVAPPRGLSGDALDLVERMMRDAVNGDGDPEARDQDLLGTICTEHLETGGKRVRARLALASAEALGVSRARAAPWAAAVEVLHNATLVHDDVQDGDAVRRGLPTTWARHGMPQAINAGDLMLMLPLSRLVAACDVDERTRWRLAHALSSRAEAVVRGQAADLSLRARIDRPVEEGGPDPLESYLRAVGGKTAALFALPVEGAALLAGYEVDEAHRLAEPFFTLGLLFQIQDDVLDLFGDKGRGTPGNDVKEGKISALVVEHLRRSPEDRGWLFGILDAPRAETSEDDVRRVIDRFRRRASPDGAPSTLARTIRRALHLASGALAAPALDDKQALRALTVETVAMVLAPIQHLTAGLDEPAEQSDPTYRAGVGARHDEDGENDRERTA